MAARRRPRKPAPGQLEDALLKNQRWSGLKAQQQLQQARYTPQQNQRDRIACKRLIDEGYGSDATFLTWLYAQK